MSLDQAEGRISARRRDVVVCIPIHGGHEHFVACLESVLEHTPAGVAILVADDASPDRRSERHLRELVEADRREVFYLRHERNVGFPANANAAFARCAPADVVLLNSDCVVAAGWLEGLREAAYIDDAIATATALTNNGTIVSVPENWTPAPSLPTGMSLTEAAAAVRSRSLRLRPRILTAIGHCMYLRRSALELVGDFDLAFSPGYGEEVDFSQRCLRSGLHHVVADDVLVFHRGGASFAASGAPHPAQGEHELLIAERYPYYHETVRATQRDLSSPLVHALGVARRALTGLTVTLDARGATGAHEVEEVRSLAAALEQTGRARVAVLTHATSEPTQRTDVIHRLFGFRDQGEVARLAALAERLIVSQRDLIAYQAPTWFASFGAWERHRSLIRLALAAADHVSFPTQLVRDEAVGEGLVPAERAGVVPGVPGIALVPGALPLAGAEPVAPRPLAPSGAPPLESAREMILVLGSDRHHENRVFALRVLQELQRAHGWAGALVLAGARVPGGSRSDERALLAGDATLAAAVVEVEAHGEAERAWLLRRAGLVLQPALGVGFETVPFEAAAQDVPCLWPQGTWMDSLAPMGTAAIVAWDPRAGAELALRLLADQQARVENVVTIRAVAARLSVEATAERLLELYGQVCDARPRRGLARGRPGWLAGAGAGFTAREEAADIMAPVPVQIFEGRAWQMPLGERAAVEGVLTQLRPVLAIEIGTAEGACLQRIAAYAEEVHSFDLTAPAIEVPDNVTLHTGDSHALLPAFLAELAEQDRNVDFVMVDGDHSPEGVRQDIEDLLDSPALAKTVILIHDTANPRVRQGIDAVRYTAWPKVSHVELDWVPGQLFALPALRNELWCGIGLVLVDAARPAYTSALAFSDEDGARSVYQQRYHPAGHLLSEIREIRVARDHAPPGTMDVHHEVGELRKRVAELGAELGSALGREAALAGELTTTRHQLEGAARALENIKGSISWRATAPLRDAVRALRRPGT